MSPRLWPGMRSLECIRLLTCDKFTGEGSQHGDRRWSAERSWRYDLDIKNFVEDGVASYVDEALTDDVVFCKCRRCRLDVMALALNELKPKYVVTPKGYAFARSDELEAQFLADTIVAVRRAMKVVRENPRHQPERNR